MNDKIEDVSGVHCDGDNESMRCLVVQNNEEVQTIEGVEDVVAENPSKARTPATDRNKASYEFEGREGACKVVEVDGKDMLSCGTAEEFGSAEGIDYID